MEREIPVGDANRLRTLAGVGEFGDIPPSLEAKFWELKNITDRVGVAIGYSDLYMLAFLDGQGSNMSKADPTVIDLWKSGKVKFDDQIQVIWRKQKVECPIKGITGNDEVVVEINGESRKIPVDKAKVLEPVDA